MVASMSRVDWLSLTLDVQNAGESPEWRALAVSTRVAELTGNMLLLDEEKIMHGRNNYAWSIGCEGARAYFSARGDVLLEITGRGCLALHEAGMLKAIVAGHVNQITRIDHATDLETDISPFEFCQQVRRQPRSKSQIRSETGETVYMGSMKSDRYARVYRYAEPHTRAKWLRVEHVFRSKEARRVAAIWLAVGDDVLASDAGETFGWKHEAWSVDQGEKIAAWKPETRDGKKLVWIERQVVPAISKGLSDGSLTTQGIAAALRRGLSTTQLTDLASDLLPSIAPAADR